MAAQAKKLTNEEKEKCRVLTPEFRVSYPHLFKPNAMPGTNQAPKYSVTMLFEKDTDLTELKKAIRQAKVNAFGKDKDEWPKTASPVTDGDHPKFAEKEGYAGCWVIKASSNQDQKPGLVDESGRREITEASRFYPGCYARAYVYAYVWEFPKNSGKFGVGLILDHVQKLRDGDPFGGRKSAQEVFGAASGYEEESDDETDSDTETNFGD